MTIHDERPEDEITGAGANGAVRDAFRRALARTAARHSFTPAGIAAAVDEAALEAMLVEFAPLAPGGPIVAHLCEWDIASIRFEGPHEPTGGERIVLTVAATWYQTLDPGGWISIACPSYGLRTTARILGATFTATEAAGCIHLTAIMPIGGAQS